MSSTAGTVRNANQAEQGGFAASREPRLPLPRTRDIERGATPHHHHHRKPYSSQTMFHQGYRGRYPRPRILFLATELAAGQGQGRHVSKLDRETGPQSICCGAVPQMRDQGRGPITGAALAPWD